MRINSFNLVDDNIRLLQRNQLNIAVNLLRDYKISWNVAPKPETENVNGQL